MHSGLKSFLGIEIFLCELFVPEVWNCRTESVMCIGCHIFEMVFSVDMCNVKSQYFGGFNFEIRLERDARMVTQWS